MGDEPTSTSTSVSTSTASTITAKGKAESESRVDFGDGVTGVLKNEQLNIVGQDLEALPEVLRHGGGFDDLCQHVTKLDLSWNDLSALDEEVLLNFKNLRVLVVDNNNIRGQRKLPDLPTLDTFWCNSNQVEQLESFIDDVAAKCPNLTYLSMLKNPACPNYFTGKNSTDYKRYRMFVVSRIPGLKFLDATAVTAEELAEAKRMGHKVKVARPSAQQYEQQPQQQVLPEGVRGLDEVEDTKERGQRANFGISTYTYYGKQSEGNRFIIDDDL